MDQSFSYAEAYYFESFGPGSPTNGTDPCQLFHAMTGVRYEDQGTGGRNGGEFQELPFCQDHNEVVTIFNVKFMERTSEISPNRLMSDILQEWWAETMLKLTHDFVKTVKLRMLSEVLELSMIHQQRLRVPMVLQWVHDSIIEELTSGENGISEAAAKAQALRMFVDDRAYPTFDCGQANATGELSQYVDYLPSGDLLHTKEVTVSLGVIGDVRRPYRTVDDFGCPWSTKQSIEEIEQIIRLIPNYDQPLSYMLTSQQAGLLLGNEDIITGSTDPRSIVTLTGGELWMRASNGDQGAIKEVATALCDFGDYNSSNVDDLRMCGNQTLALLDVFYFSNHSWANHPITRQSFLQDMVFTPRYSAVGIHCGPMDGPGILTDGEEVPTNSGGECNIAFSPYMASFKTETYGVFQEFYPGMLRDGQRNTLGPNIVSLMFTKGTEVSLLDLDKSTNWYQAIKYCESVERSLDTSCVGMRNSSRMTENILPQIFAYEEGYENDFLATSEGNFREHFVNQVCSVANYLRYHIENSTYVGDTVAALLDKRFSHLALDMGTHSNLHRLGYAQFGSGAITPELFDGARSIAEVNTSEVEDWFELPEIAARFGWTNASLSWEDAESVLAQLSSTWGGHGFGEGSAQGNLGSVLNSALLNHTFTPFGVQNLSGDPSAGVKDWDLIENATMPTTAPTNAPTMPIESYKALSALTRRYMPRNCSARAGICTDENAFGASLELNTTRGRILTTHALDLARQSFFIGKRLWCDYSKECDYLKGGMFKSVRAKDFLFEGYNDPFLVKQTKEATAKVFGSSFECRTPKFFVELDEGLVPYTEGMDRVKTYEENVVLPFGYFYHENKRCIRQGDFECGSDGFQINLPSGLFTSMSNGDYQANPADADPFFYDRDLTQTNGYHNLFRGEYPSKWEFYKPELTFPIKMITVGGFGYEEASVPNPIGAVFLSKTVEDMRYHRSYSCDRITKYWGSCTRLIDSGNVNISNLGKILGMYGNSSNSFYDPPLDHPWRAGKKGISLNNTLLGWSVDPKLWAGFELPPPPKEIVVFVDELILPFKMYYEGPIYYPYAPDLPWSMELKGETLTELRADKPGVRFAEIALDVFCATADSWDFTRAATNKTDSPLRSIHLRGIGHGMHSNYFLSPPHYLYDEGADGVPQERKKYKGLAPNEQHHRTCYKYDPLTGEAFSEEKRYQLNYKVVRSVLYPKLAHEEFHWPIVWFERGFVRYPEEAFEFHSNVLVWMGLQRLVMGIGAGFGFLGVLVGCLTWRIARAEQKRRIDVKKSAYEVSKRM
jgi:hypothetical protein